MFNLDFFSAQAHKSQLCCTTSSPSWMWLFPPWGGSPTAPITSVSNSSSDDDTTVFRQHHHLPGPKLGALTSVPSSRWDRRGCTSCTSWRNTTCQCDGDILLLNLSSPPPSPSAMLLPSRWLAAVSLQDLYNSRTLRRASKSAADSSHPGHKAFVTLPPGRRVQSITTPAPTHPGHCSVNVLQ